ncbi:MAG: metallophosphoesterase [Bacteroidota bacterium]
MMVKVGLPLLVCLLAYLHTIPQDVLLPYNSSFKYLDDGSNLQSNWRSTWYNDEKWKSGSGWFGYGISPLELRTKTGYGTDANNKHITTYFRKEFVINDYDRYSNFTCSIRRDDGVIVFLNGLEVFRNNMPRSNITYNTYASAKGDNGLTALNFQLNKNQLKKGRNVFAVEIHQYRKTDIDKVFALQLTGKKIANDTIAPYIKSIKRLNPLIENTSASHLMFRVTFSEKVIGVDAKDFVFPGYNPARGYIVSVTSTSTTSNTYDIAMHPITGEGKLSISLRRKVSGITDLAGNPVSERYDYMETYLVKQPAGLQITRGPYLQSANTNSVTFRWRTNGRSNSVVQVGTRYGVFTKTASEGSLTSEHIITMSGLVPGTKYYYKLGSSSETLAAGTDNYFYTAPVGDGQKIKIAVFGDCGRKQNRANVLSAYLNHVKSSPAELMLLLGDNAYEDGTDSEYQKEFFEPYESTILKNHVLFPTPGNHDYHTTSQTSRSAPYFKNFTVPTNGECGGVPSGTKAYYSFDWGNIHFLSLDSYGEEGSAKSRMYDTLSPQVNWVKKDLAANKKPWVIAFWHHPPYSMGSRNSDIEDEMRKIRENFIRILERHGVDLVMCGHSHVYERSYLLNNYYGREAAFDVSKHTKSASSGKDDGTPNSSPFQIKAGASNHGTIYVVSGSASQAGRIEADKFPHNALPFAFNEEGMFYLEIDKNRLVGKFIQQDNVVADQFTIVQNPAGTNIAGITNQAPEITDDEGIQLYPGLVKRGMEITVLSKSSGSSELLLADMQGSIIATYQFTGRIIIPTAKLAAGTYIVKVNRKDGVNSYQRFVVIE